ncbi:ATPase H+ transporting accessory protein 1a [Scyliorhinus torazame]
MLHVREFVFLCCLPDNIIGQVLETLKTEEVPFLAIFTASRPSRIVREGPIISLGPRRQLLAEKEKEPYPPLAYNLTAASPCILFWAARIQISNGDKLVDLTNRTFGDDATVNIGTSTCSNLTANLALEYNNVESLGALRIVFRMSRQLYNVSAKHWFTLDQVEIYSNGERISFNVTQVYAPAIYSYHCKRVAQDYMSSSILPWSSSTSSWVVIFEDFQIQGFGVKGMKFSYANDCASFFTPAIWMGLLTTLLMVFILTYGLHMITSLKTMDRFDDPKGPSISVPQTE